MIKVLKITIHQAPHKHDADQYIMDVCSVNDDGSTNHASWASSSMAGCITGIPQTIELLSQKKEVKSIYA